MNHHHPHTRWLLIGVIVALGVVLCAGCLLVNLVSKSALCPGGLCPVDCPDDCPPCPGGVCPTPTRKQLAGLRILRRPPGSQEPVVDLPEAMRQKNYEGGSCVHASTITLMRWNGLDEMAAWWRENHGQGEYADRLNKKMEAAGLRYAYTTSGDMRFLEWCIRTRRGAGIGYYPSHAINLVDLTKTEAVLLDNNRTHTYIRVPRAEFERKWKHQYGGWAWTLVYVPPPPKPWRGK